MLTQWLKHTHIPNTEREIIECGHERAANQSSKAIGSDPDCECKTMARSYTYQWPTLSTKRKSRMVSTLQPDSFVLTSAQFSSRCSDR